MPVQATTIIILLYIYCYYIIHSYHPIHLTQTNNQRLFCDIVLFVCSNKYIVVLLGIIYKKKENNNKNKKKFATNK